MKKNVTKNSQGAGNKHNKGQNNICNEKNTDQENTNNYKGQKPKNLKSNKDTNKDAEDNNNNGNQDGQNNQSNNKNNKKKKQNKENKVVGFKRNANHLLNLNDGKKKMKYSERTSKKEIPMCKMFENEASLALHSNDYSSDCKARLCSTFRNWKCSPCDITIDPNICLRPQSYFLSIENMISILSFLKKHSKRIKKRDIIIGRIIPLSQSLSPKQKVFQKMHGSLDCLSNTLCLFMIFWRSSWIIFVKVKNKSWLVYDTFVEEALERHTEICCLLADFIQQETGEKVIEDYVPIFDTLQREEYQNGLMILIRVYFYLFTDNFYVPLNYTDYVDKVCRDFYFFLLACKSNNIVHNLFKGNERDLYWKSTGAQIDSQHITNASLEHFSATEVQSSISVSTVTTLVSEQNTNGQIINLSSRQRESDHLRKEKSTKFQIPFHNMFENKNFLLLPSNEYSSDCKARLSCTMRKWEWISTTTNKKITTIPKSSNILSNENMICIVNMLTNMSNRKKYREVIVGDITQQAECKQNKINLLYGSLDCLSNTLCLFMIFWRSSWIIFVKVKNKSWLVYDTFVEEALERHTEICCLLADFIQQETGEKVIEDYVPIFDTLQREEYQNGLMILIRVYFYLFTDNFYIPLNYTDYVDKVCRDFYIFLLMCKSNSVVPNLFKEKERELYLRSPAAQIKLKKSPNIISLSKETIQNLDNPNETRPAPFQSISNENDTLFEDDLINFHGSVDSQVPISSSSQKYIPTSKSKKYVPLHKSKSNNCCENTDTGLPVGMLNPKFNCYAISVLQMFFATDMWKHLILYENRESDSGGSHLIIKELNHLKKCMDKENSKIREKSIVVDPSKLINLMNTEANRSPDSQQDSADFFIQLLNIIATNSLLNTSITSSVGINYFMRRKCLECDQVRISGGITHSNMYHIYYEENTPNSSLLNMLTAENKYRLIDNNGVGNVECEFCSRRTLQEDKMFIAGSSKYIIFHIARFKNNSNGYCEKKRTKLDLDDYMNLNFLRDKDYTENMSYKLLCFCEHIGSCLESGHYITYVKMHEKWYKCDDHKVFLCRNNVNKNKEVYLCVYERLIDKDYESSSESTNSVQRLEESKIVKGNAAYILPSSLKNRILSTGTSFDEYLLSDKDDLPAQPDMITQDFQYDSMLCQGNNNHDSKNNSRSDELSYDDFSKSSDNGYESETSSKSSLSTSTWEELQGIDVFVNPKPMKRETYLRNSRCVMNIDSIHITSKSIGEIICLLSMNTNVSMNSFIDQSKVLKSARIKHFVQLESSRKNHTSQNHQIVPLEKYQHLQIAVLVVENMEFYVSILDLRYERTMGIPYFTKKMVFMITQVLNSALREITKSTNKGIFQETTISELKSFNSFFHQKSSGMKSVCNRLSNVTFHELMRTFEEKLLSISEKDVKYENDIDKKIFESFSQSISKEAKGFYNNKLYLVSAVGMQNYFSFVTPWEGNKSIAEHLYQLDNNLDGDKETDYPSNLYEESKERVKNVTLEKIDEIYTSYENSALDQLMTTLSEKIFNNAANSDFNSCAVYFDLGMDITSMKEGISYMFSKKESIAELRKCIRESNKSSARNNLQIENPIFSWNDSVVRERSKDIQYFAEDSKSDISVGSLSSCNEYQYTLSDESDDKDLFLYEGDNYDFNHPEDVETSKRTDLILKNTYSLMNNKEYKKWKRTYKINGIMEYLMFDYVDLHSGRIKQGRQPKILPSNQLSEDHVQEVGYEVVTDTNDLLCGAQMYLKEFRQFYSKKQFDDNYSKLHDLSTYCLNILLPDEQRNISLDICIKEIGKRMDIIKRIPYSIDHYGFYDSNITARTEFFLRFLPGKNTQYTFPDFHKCLKSVKTAKLIKYVRESLEDRLVPLIKVFLGMKTQLDVKESISNLSPEARLCLLECAEFLERLMCLKPSSMKTYNFFWPYFQKQGILRIPKVERFPLVPTEKKKTGLKFGLNKKVLVLGETNWSRLFNLSQNLNRRTNISTVDKKIYESMMKNLSFKRSKNAELVKNSIVNSIMKTFHSFGEKGKNHYIVTNILKYRCP